MKRTKLKRCPFCGAAAWLGYYRWVFSDARDGYRVECQGRCHAMTCYWHTDEQAIAAWNERQCRAGGKDERRNGETGMP